MTSQKELNAKLQAMIDRDRKFIISTMTAWARQEYPQIYNEYLVGFQMDTLFFKALEDKYSG